MLLIRDAVICKPPFRSGRINPFFISTAYLFSDLLIEYISVAAT